MMDDTLREHAWRCDCGAQGVVEAQTEEESLTRAHAAHNASNPACRAYDDSPAYWRSAPDPLASLCPVGCPEGHVLLPYQRHLRRLVGGCPQCGRTFEPTSDPYLMMSGAESAPAELSFGWFVAMQALYYRMRQLDPIFARRYARIFVRAETPVILTVSDDHGGAT